ncbi:tRNA (adenosine(37)-N6)-threonylcarbamoyltransferase complex dimerization subunit type 1 TsaB [Buchnera aphidicola (Mollitrichosiphum nigrofasciatum)]|uniref:tRNA (adenosine(37)-N6)-threonylcarbamoyltransferase complex dimerization subunit type 1 TsaB n=1 Tax=Buchnera aphidicola TaxID=9 RepID=UPI0031B86536
MILSIDNSTKKCSITLFKNDCYYTISIIHKKIKNSKILILIKNILYYKKKNIKNLKYIIFSKGPGSFIGIRISFSIIKTFYLIYKIPYIGISKIKSLLEKVWRTKKKKKIIFLISATYKKFYFIQYVKKKKWMKKEKKTYDNEKIHKVCKYIKKKWYILNYINNNIFCTRCKNKKKYIYPDTKDLVSIFLLNKF